MLRYLVEASTERFKCHFLGDTWRKLCHFETTPHNAPHGGRTRNELLVPVGLGPSRPQFGKPAAVVAFEALALRAASRSRPRAVHEGDSHGGERLPYQAWPRYARCLSYGTSRSVLFLGPEP